MLISVQSMQQCIFIFTHRGSHVCTLKFWSTLRPLIAFLIFILFIGMGVLVGGGWAKKAKAKMKKKSKQTNKARPGRETTQE